MVFVKRDSNPGQDLTVAAQTGVRVRKGEVGLEIECESKAAGVFPKEPTVAKYWGYHHDGSLRGADNAEYTLLNPLTFEEADKAVDELFNVFKEKKVTLAESVRTSVHVHLNVGQFYQNRLASLLALWFIHEEILSHFCGDHRAGNLFCIRAKDGPAIVTEVKDWLANKGEYGLTSDGLHYSALNMSALYKFGSVEIRTMRGLTKPEPVKQWVRILRKIYDESAKYSDPRTIIEQFSLLGPMEFFHSLFGEEANSILAAVQNDVNVTASLYEGMRFAQDIAYSRDWSVFNPVKAITDPFGRKNKKTRVMPRLQVNDPDVPATPQPTLNTAGARGQIWNENTLAQVLDTAPRQWDITRG